MKTILVLTDFSESALRAAETAAIVAGKFHANVLLFNSNYTIPAIPYSPGVVLVNDNISWEEECEKKLSHLAQHLKKIISEVNTARHKPSVRTLLLEGDLLNNVNDIIKNENVELIVMGGRSGGNIDHVLFGSDISIIIDHALRPVLIIPTNSHMIKLDRVIFATNFEESDRYAITYLMKLGALFQYQLEIVHISLYGDHGSPQNPDVVDFIKELEETKYPNVMYKDIRGKSIIKRLDHLCEEREADILAFTHQKHSYVARMFNKSIIKKSLPVLKLPLLIFPPGLHDKYKNQ